MIYLLINTLWNDLFISELFVLMAINNELIAGKMP